MDIVGKLWNAQLDIRKRKGHSHKEYFYDHFTLSWISLEKRLQKDLIWGSLR